jgi:hypothetical protein
MADLASSEKYSRKQKISSNYFLMEQIVFGPLQSLTRTLSIELSLERLRIRRDPEGSLK